MNVSIAPARAVLGNKLGKFSVQFGKARFVLPRLSALRFDVLRLTAPGAESSVRAVNVGFVVLPHVPAGDYR